MKPDVRAVDGKIVVRPKDDDAIARLRALNLRAKVASSRLTEEERDAVLLALLQAHNLL